MKPVHPLDEYNNQLHEKGQDSGKDERIHAIIEEAGLRGWLSAMRRVRAQLDNPSIDIKEFIDQEISKHKTTLQ
jgi:hypothetical protein